VETVDDGVVVKFRERYEAEEVFPSYMIDDSF
jgi:hypothetical protein